MQGLCILQLQDQDATAEAAEIYKTSFTKQGDLWHFPIGVTLNFARTLGIRSKEVSLLHRIAAVSKI